MGKWYRMCDSVWHGYQCAKPSGHAGDHLATICWGDEPEIVGECPPVSFGVREVKVRPYNPAVVKGWGLDITGDSYEEEQ